MACRRCSTRRRAVRCYSAPKSSPQKLQRGIHCHPSRRPRHLCSLPSLCLGGTFAWNQKPL